MFDFIVMMRKLFKYYKPYRYTLGLALGGALAVAILELIFPMCLRYIMQDLLPQKDIAQLLQAAAVMAAAYLLTCVISYKSSVIGRTVAAKIEQDMRHDLFAHVQKLSFNFFDNQRVGQLVSRIVSDVGEIREMVFLAPNYLFVCIFMMLGTMVMLFYINWQLAILVNILLVGKAYDSVSTNRKMKKAGRAARVEVGSMNAQTTESLNAIRLVQSFTNEAAELSKLDASCEKLLQARKRSFELLGHSNVSMVFFSNVTNLVIIVVGSMMIAYDKMLISDLITFLLYVSVFIRPVLRLNALVDVYQKGVAGYQRFEELLQEELEIKDLPGAVDVEEVKGDICFENITFSYRQGEPILENFNLKVRAGESVALVGGTGVGKSTVCSLLPRFYEPQQGRITIDGRDIKDFTLLSLRKHIGFVQQDIFLFADTVRNNIAYGNLNAAGEEIIKTAKLTEVDRFVEKLPKKYATELGERGVKLSGGQKQRIAIARAFLKNPPILVLDEATSSLDNTTERAIQHSLDKLSQNRTTLVIAHRLATIQDVNRIVVLGPKGTILEEGTHKELMEAQGEYYKLYNAQFEK